MLRREISGRGLVEAFLTLVLIAMLVGVVFDRRGRGGDAALAGVLLVVLLLGRVSPSRTAAWREKRARRGKSRAPRVYTARKRRAVGILILLFVYLMIRPDRNGSLVVAAAYSFVFCILILVVMNVRKQHFIGFVSRLAGRSSARLPDSERGIRLPSRDDGGDT